MATSKRESSNVVVKMFDLAAKGNATELANLIRKRKDRSFLDWIDKKGRKLIHVAALNGSTSCVFQMIHLGNDIESKCAQGNTSLHYACMDSSLPTIIVLLHLNGNIQVINKNGEIPIDLIPSVQQAEFISILQEAEAVQLKKREQYSSSMRSYNNFQPGTEQNRQFVLGDKYPVLLMARNFLTDFSKEMFKGSNFVYCKGRFESNNVTVKYIPDNIYTQKIHVLLNEASVLGKLRHPNILLLLGISSQPNTTYQLAFEEVYSFLYHAIFEVELEFLSEEILRIARDISSALHYIHFKGYTHCAIGSHSIVLTGKLNAKICNFEHVQIISDAKPISHLSFSHPYMAPAQLEGQKADTANDIYGLGISVFECATRKKILDVRSLLKNFSRRETTNLLFKMIPKTYEHSISSLISSCLEKLENRTSALQIYKWSDALLDGGLAAPSPMTMDGEEDLFPIDLN